MAKMAAKLMGQQLIAQTQAPPQLYGLSGRGTLGYIYHPRFKFTPI